MAERVTIFIDGSNFYHALMAEMDRADIDFYALARKLCGTRDYIRTYYYNAPLDQTADPRAYAAQQKFFDALHATPYVTLKLGRLVKRSGIYVEKGIDIKIAVDMIGLALKNAYDTAILVSGDGDFADAVEAVKDLGKHVENACPKKSLARHLQQACDKVTILDAAFLEDCWLREKHGGSC